MMMRLEGTTSRRQMVTACINAASLLDCTRGVQRLVVAVGECLTASGRQAADLTYWKAACHLTGALLGTVLYEMLEGSETP